MRILASAATARSLALSAAPLCRWVVIFLSLLLMLLFAVRPARAQLLVGVDDPSEPIWALDLVTNQATPVLTGFACAAMAVDANTDTLYFMTNTVTLYKWNLSTPQTPPALVGTTVNTSGANLSLTGLAFDTVNNRLLASRTLDSASGPEGFYEVNTNTGVSTLQFGVPAVQFDFGGFDYDVATGNFYAANDDADARGLYRVDFANSLVQFVAPYPFPTTVDPPDLDAVAVGNLRVFMVEDRAVQVGGKVYVYNIASGQYEQPLQTPWFFNEVFAGATYIPNFGQFMASIPEPASASLVLVCGAALGLRRSACRRR